ncbi:MAG: hypothetical protein QNJ11_07315 [Woeseiaceae bacterium]|nr:hypothetical protein [Woeseiaceae bacterium]
MLATGLLIVLLGGLAIALATASAWVRLPAFVVWVVFSCRELLALRRGWRRCHRIRILADGGVEILGQSGAWYRAGLADGSVLLRRYGWLRLDPEDGAVIHEPVRGNRRRDPDWRRLHVIWRHV